MIRYALQCEFDHGFEAWFSSSEGYDEQAASGQVACPHCGSVSVTKAIMAPSVRTARKAEAASEAEASTRRAMAEMAHRLRSHVEANFDYVGSGFASEARDIHDGLAPERPIYGEASGEEVKSLIEDGIPVAPIPGPSNPPAALPAAETPKALPKSRLN